MAIQLRNVAAGVSQNSCNPDLPVTQAIQIKPYNPNSCQTTGPISPAKQATSITVRNLIADACGVLYWDIDNAGEGQSDRIVWFGGPRGLENTVAPIVYPEPNGFDTASFIAELVNGPTLAGGGTWAYGLGIRLTDEFWKGQNSIIASRFLVERLDTSVAANNQLLNNAFEPFIVDDSTTYKQEKSGAGIYSTQTSTGSGSTVTAEWCFGDAGVPLSQTTGVEFVIPAEFDGRIGVCIGAVQSNIEYSEGC